MDCVVRLSINGLCCKRNYIGKIQQADLLLKSLDKFKGEYLRYKRSVENKQYVDRRIDNCQVSST